MKSAIILFSTLLFLALNTSAQKKAFKEAKGTMSTGTETPLKVSIFSISVDDAMDKWEDLMEDKEAAAIEYKNELFADNALIAQIHNGPMDILAAFSENEKTGDVQLSVLFDLGGALLTSSNHPDKYKNAIDFLQSFAKETSEESLNSHLKETEKQIKRFEKERKNLLKENENLEKQISQNNNDLKDFNRQIEEAQLKSKNLQKKLKDL